MPIAPPSPLSYQLGRLASTVWRPSCLLSAVARGQGHARGEAGLGLDITAAASLPIHSSLELILSFHSSSHRPPFSSPCFVLYLPLLWVCVFFICGLSLPSLLLASQVALTPYGCGSNNVKHFALASFCNLQFSNVRPVESSSDNGHALPPAGPPVPEYLPSINATAGSPLCNNT